MTTAGIEVVEARARFGPIEVLHGVSATFPAGAIVALLGRNGAGKSTLLRVLAGTMPVSTGTVRWDGQDITRLGAFTRAQRGVTLVPDRGNVFDALSVRDNLRVFAGGIDIEGALVAFPELEPLLDQPGGTLSGGERQMVALSRAVLRPGRVVLLDEVSRGLSPGVVARLTETMRGLAAPDRVIVIVEQYLHDVLQLADVVYVLRRGDIAFAGEPAELAATAGELT